MLLHILLFDRAYNVTYWVNYSELRAQLRRRFTAVEAAGTRAHRQSLNQTTLAARLASEPGVVTQARGQLLHQYAPRVGERAVGAVTATVSPNGGFSVVGLTNELATLGFSLGSLHGILHSGAALARALMATVTRGWSWVGCGNLGISHDFNLGFRLSIAG